MRTRDLTRAVTLRPAEVEQLYGVNRATLRNWCIRPENPLPSILVRGKSGRKGVRLIERVKLETWLAQYATA
jgi:hypothetical protein